MGVNVLGVINDIRSCAPMIRHNNEGKPVVNAASISGFIIHRGRSQGSYSMEALRGAMGPGLPPLVGLRVLQATRDREFYILTRAGERATIKARHDRIQASFERAEAWEKTR
jgi:hypothetical protein